MHNSGNKIQGIITHLFFNPKSKIETWNVRHLSLHNICGLNQNRTLLFQNPSNPTCSIRFMSLISPTFKTTNTLSNLVFSTIKSSMQIGFIWQLTGKGVMHDILPTPPCWKRIGMIEQSLAIISPKNFLEVPHFRKYFMIDFCIVDLQKKLGKNSLLT